MGLSAGSYPNPGTSSSPLIGDPARWEIDALFVVWGLTFLHASLRPTRAAYREQLIALAAVSALVPLVNALTSDLHLGTTLFSGSARRDRGLAAVDLTLLAVGAVAGAVALGVTISGFGMAYGLVVLAALVNIAGLIVALPLGWAAERSRRRTVPHPRS